MKKTKQTKPIFSVTKKITTDGKTLYVAEITTPYGLKVRKASYHPERISFHGHKIC
jgi:uncharacterized protein (UPF0305 family)